MKTIRLFTFIFCMGFLSQTAAAGWGGSGGGPKPETRRLVTVEVCDSGESGTECRTVRYELRPASAAVPEICWTTHGEAAVVPCPKTTGVPLWLKRLNQAFTK